IVPTSKPRLSNANTYTSVENIIAKTLPSIGTKKTNRIIVNRTAAIVMPMHKYGTSFPSIRPARLNGLTSNCSRVPRSRSRTRAMAAATVVLICNTTPITPGKKKILRANVRDVKHLGTNIDRYAVSAGIAHHGVGVLVERDKVRV